MDELEDYLISQNPWWTGKHAKTSHKRQLYLNKIIRTLKHTNEIVIISGIRRSGKTTLMYQTITHLIDECNINPRQILFISCDNKNVQKLEDPLQTIISLFQKYAGMSNDLWLFFDEIQTIENFQSQLKNLYDSGRYHIVISGSTSHILESKSGTYLTGRYIPINVYPLSFYEYLSFTDMQVPATELDAISHKYELIKLLNCYVQNGGFPATAMIADEDVVSDLLKAYYDSIVYRDIIHSHSVRNESVLCELLLYLITNVSTPQTYRKLSNLFKSEPSTIQDYISYAEDGNLIYQVQKFSFSYKKQLVAPKKIYIADSGIRKAVGFIFSKDTGRLVENLVFLELLRRGHKPKYWNETNEIDFVVRGEDSVFSLINVCYSDNVPERELLGFAEFEAMYPDIKTRKLIITDDLTREFEGGVYAVPLWKWLLLDAGSPHF